jgi:hypothetical protein
LVSGSILMLSKSENISEKDLVWEREDGDHQLRSVLQFNRESYRIDKKPVRTALLIDEFIGSDEKLNPLDDGRYEIVSQEHVKLRWAHINITQSFIIVDKSSNKVFVKNVINNALNQEIVHFIQLDTQKISEDNNDQWTRCFSDRQGHVQSGTFFGDGVEKDIVFEKEMRRSDTKAVGIHTTFFGNITKVRISYQGVVTVYNKSPYPDFIRFIIREVLPYRTEIE